jgi:hypothetical protein
VHQEIAVSREKEGMKVWTAIHPNLLTSKKERAAKELQVILIHIQKPLILIKTWNFLVSESMSERLAFLF